MKTLESVLLHDVGFATAASQNGFSTYKLSIHKKTNIILKFQKVWDVSHFHLLYHRADHCMTHLLSLCKNRFVMQQLQNPPLSSITIESRKILENMAVDWFHAFLIFLTCIRSYADHLCICNNVPVKQIEEVCCSSSESCSSQDPLGFGPPGSGSGSVSKRYWSGSGSFRHQANIVRKPFTSLSCDFLMTFYLWRMMLMCLQQVISKKKPLLLVNLRVTDEKTRIRDTGYTEHRISSK
jgi:hypothetical protein